MDESNRGVVFMSLISFIKQLTIILPDSLYIKLKYFLHFKKFPNLKNPNTFNEKLQWLKLHDRNPEYTKMVDKYEVRKYIAEKIGEEYLIPLLGVWDKAEDIDFDKLPDQFVLKCNHNSGLGMCICKDKSVLDIRKVKKELTLGLKENYYKMGREWPYKNVKPRIIAEKYMVDESGTELKDYKFLCFNGKVKLIEYHTGRFSGNHTQDFYDEKWNKTDISQEGTISDFVVEKPLMFDEMVRLSEILAENIPHVRIDWYQINDKIYFGEITFFDSSGLILFDNEDDNLYLGSLIDLKKG